MRVLDDGIADAELLQAHAARRGLEVPPEAIAAIVRMRMANGTDADAETKFWGAFSVVATLVRPVSVESLRAALPEGHSRADQAVHQYRRWSYYVLTCLAALQIYTLIGATSVADFDTVSKHMSEVSGQLLAIAQAQAQAQAQSTDVPDARRVSAATRIAAISPDVEIFELQGKLHDDLEHLQTTYGVLQQWTRGWHPVSALRTFAPVVRAAAATTDPATLADTNDEIDDFVHHPYAPAHRRTLMEAHVALTALQGYALPFLYGLLGACVFILRNLSNDVKNLSFVSDVGYQLRLPLGALSGVAIALVLDMTQGSAPLKGMTPLAIAFLAGYSVDMLFTAMDRLVTAFSGDTPSSAPKTAGS